MRKLSVNQTCHPQRPFADDVELIARAGIPGVGVHRTKLEPFGVERGARLLRDAGLAVSAYAAAGRFLTPGQRQQAIDDTRRVIETAAKIGAPCVVLVSGPRDGLDWDDANARFIEALAETLPFAAQHGVRLAYEPIAAVRVAVSYIHLLGDALDVVEQVNSPCFGVVLDIWYHWWQRDFAANVRRGRDRVFLVQVSDHYPDADSMRDRAPLGEGMIPLKRVLKTIDEAGYSGYYDIEVFSPRFTEADHATLVQRCKAAFEHLWD